MTPRSTLTLIALLAVAVSFPSRAQNYYNPAVVMASDARCAVVYHTSASDGGQVLLSLIGVDNRPTGAPEVVNRELPGYGQNPAIASTSAGRLSLVWEQWHADGSTLYRVQYGMDGSRLTRTAECVPDTPTINAQTPRMAAGADGREVVVWLDYRLGRPAVYAQRYTKEGRKEGRNIRIADGGGSVIQTPAVAIDASGAIGIVWQETIRDSFRVVFASAAWNLHTIERVIIDKSNGQAYASTPDIAAASRAGEYWTVWKDYRTGESNIYGQRMRRGRWEQAGRLTNLRFNDDTTRNWQRLPRIAASPIGILAVWEDYRNDPQNQTGDLYAQIFDAQGRIRGGNFRVNNGPEPTIQRFPAAAMNARGAFAVVWSDSRAGGTAVYLRRGTLLAPGMEGDEVRVAP